MDLRQSLLNQTAVSLSLTSHVISSEAKDSNFAFSPLSIHVVLGLIAAGSGGPTRDQLLGVLKSNSLEDLNSLSSQFVALLFDDGGPLGGPRLSFANGVWVDQTLSFKPAYKEIVENNYKAASNRVDFQTKAAEITEKVNAWAEKETSGLIKEILPAGSVDASTRLLFANAVYFKGAWDEKFDASETRDHDFFLLNGTSIRCPFMTSTKKQYVRAFDGFKVLRLPYAQGQDKRKFSMYIFLPDTKDGLSALSEKMTSDPEFIEHHVRLRQVKVKAFRVPKFKISFGFEATEILKKMGVVHPFSGGGLTEMVESVNSQNLYVSNIFHKAFIEVNEEGTEAAAATAAVVMYRSLIIEEEVEFVADHSFLFVLREDITGVILFAGQLVDPRT
ncbi:serpin-ZX-like [Andrographis paniculata]|uniref:serpin-ZX-like n=1 Tax=Andrographis paniculata TaxID=175694 RepID=UPI0021E72F37|nr:serpin-ZX-like [Andrographis paniculata]